MTGEFAISAALVAGALFIGVIIVLMMRRSSEIVAQAAADSLADLRASTRQQLEDKEVQLLGLRQELVEEYRETFANPYVAAGRRLVDEIIEPAETRKYLALALESLHGKRELRPAKKHGLIPL